jgi:hypothetical protein
MRDEIEISVHNRYSMKVTLFFHNPCLCSSPLSGAVSPCGADLSECGGRLSDNYAKT